MTSRLRNTTDSHSAIFLKRISYVRIVAEIYFKTHVTRRCAKFSCAFVPFQQNGVSSALRRCLAELTRFYPPRAVRYALNYRGKSMDQRGHAYKNFSFTVGKFAEMLMRNFTLRNSIVSRSFQPIECKKLSDKISLTLFNDMYPYYAMSFKLSV